MYVYMYMYTYTSACIIQFNTLRVFISIYGGRHAITKYIGKINKSYSIQEIRLGLLTQE